MRVFVAWDMAQNARLKLLVERVQRKHADKYALDVLGFPGRELFGDVWEDQAGRRIVEADRLLALVDAPNVNVGFEIGYALGKGRPVALVRSVPEVPAWLDHEPLTSQLVRQTTTIDTLLDVLASEDWASTQAPPPPAGQVLLLAPGDDCSAQRDELLDLPLAWATVPPGAPVRTGLGDLPRLLAGVGRVAWVVPPSPTTPPTDDPASAAAAVTAGYALATGREVRLFRHVRARPVADHARHAHAYDTLDELVEKVRAWLTPAVGPADPVEAWRARVAGELSRATPFHTRLTGMELERVCVKVGVEGRGAEARGMEGRGEERLHDPRGASLGDFLGRVEHRAWFVAADPGAGKTTAARRLALELARNPGGALPVYLPLPDVADRLDGALDPVDMVWRLAARSEDKEREPLVATLRAAGERGTVLLFDGLDEVAPRHLAGVLATLARLPGLLPGAKVVVLTRSVMVERHPAPEPYRVATMLPLDPEQARELVRNLAGGDEPRVTKALDERPTLRDLARNPLMLTLVTLVALDAMERGADLPVRRAEVYAAAVDYLLRRGHQGQGDTRGVKEPFLAARVLAPMAFHLTRQDGVTWPPAVMHDAVTEGRRALGESDAWLFKETWGTNAAFLEDLAQNAGICAPEHGPGSVWRFLHNTLREYLAAVELHGRGEEAVEAFEAEWGEAVGKWERAKWETNAAGAPDRPALTDPARWGEVHALYCGITTSPMRALTRLRERSPAIFARALPQADVSAKVAVGMLAEPELWTGKHRWIDDCVLALVAVHGADAARPLLDLLSPRASTLQIGLTAWALETLDRFDAAEVFGRSRPGVTPPTLDAVPISAGSFWMGSREGVGEDREHPRHRVTLTWPFRLGRTTVRADEWHVFSGGDHPRNPRLPAFELSWYEAWAFARWVGGELPTEAEREYACRAGTDTRWSHGDDGAKLGEYAWFGKNAWNKAHPVAKRKPNPWGLYDMHGNVWEWCRDALRNYGTDVVTDPLGPVPPLGAPGWRAVRGGGYWDDADWCRSAYRGRVHPWSRGNGLGFRVRLPPP